MRIAIGADHAGYELKEIIKHTLDELRMAYKDFGTDSDESVDYPDFAVKVARGVAADEFDRGILICGTGIGMALAANKVNGVRAAPVMDLETARLAREHNNANVLALGARVTPPERALDIVRIFSRPSSKAAATSGGSARSPHSSKPHLRPVRRPASHERARPASSLARAAPAIPVAPSVPAAPAAPLPMTTTTTRLPLLASLAESDPEIARAIRDEIHRQNTGLELIASENFVSRAVLEAAGSVLTNKYAEGYPGRRYYGGCEFVDVAESLAIARARALFGADHANVQPHSGAQANMSVCLSVLQPGDTVLGMNLAHGGHLTHGHPLNFSGKLYRIVPYGVRPEDERLDYDELEKLAHQHRPKLIIVGASAYPRVIDFARIAAVARETGALVMTDMAHIAGLVATGLHSSPVPHSDFVTTTTHKTLRGPRGGLVLCRSDRAKDLDRSVFPGVQGGPLMHIIAAKAVCFREAASTAFADYQRQIVANARRLAEAIAAEGFRLVSGGTDNHLMLVDVFSKGITGKVAEAALGRAGITVNKNAIPFDRNPPLVASGVRIGTPAVTTRGMREGEMERIASFFGRVLAAPDDESVAAAVKRDVEALCAEFPLYPEELGVARA